MSPKQASGEYNRNSEAGPCTHSKLQTYILCQHEKYHFVTTTISKQASETASWFILKQGDSLLISRGDYCGLKSGKLQTYPMGPSATLVSIYIS